MSALALLGGDGGNEVMAFRDDVTAAVLVKVENRVCNVGVGMVDMNTMRLEVCEFRDNEDFAILESVIMQIRASECLLLPPDSIAIAKKVQKVLDACEVIAVHKKKDFFDAKHLEQDLARILPPSDSIKNHLTEIALPLGSSCLACLLKECITPSIAEFAAKCRLRVFPIATIMRLDKAAFSALSILPNTGDGSRSSKSLYGMLNKCRTSIGSRRLHTWICQPLVDPISIHHRQDLVSIFVKNPSLRQDVQGDHLRKVPDLDRIAAGLHTISVVKGTNQGGVSGGTSKMKRGGVTLEDLVRVYDCVVESGRLLRTTEEFTGEERNGDEMKAIVGGGEVDGVQGMEVEGGGGSSEGVMATVEDEQRRGGEIVIRGEGGGGKDGGGGSVQLMEEMICRPLREVVKGFGPFLKLVEYSVDLQEAQNGNYIISREFQPALKKLAEEKDVLRSKMDSYRQELEQRLFGSLSKGRKGMSDEIIRLFDCSTQGFVFRVTKKDQTAVQNNKECQKIRLNKNEYLFTTSRLRQLCEAYDAKAKQYEKEQQQLVAKALSVASTFWPAVEGLSSVISTVDILATFAAVATLNGYCRPLLEPGLFTTLIRLVPPVGSSHLPVSHRMSAPSYPSHALSSFTYRMLVNRCWCHHCEADS
eukprot:GHVQ01000489.1.p1 GENE.GHVQ01000489.1~~GHVQ01000489.1.p1  ORF type:complete len:645 (+),score=121.29 GHVQ01000489.1:653-2587(+)